MTPSAQPLMTQMPDWLIECGTDAERHLFSPEHSLLLALFLDAIHCYYSRNPHERATAERWVARENTDDICSFVSICDLFDLDPVRVRRTLARRRRLEAPPSIKKYSSRGAMQRTT